MLKHIRSPRVHVFHGTVFEALAAPSAGSEETAAWIVTMPPGAGGATHSVTREEIFIGLDGEAEVHGEGPPMRLAAGEALVVPAGVRFSLANTSDRVFRAVAMLPVGGQARLVDGTCIDPPWAQ